MAAVHFSRRAEEDLSEIGLYTLGKWGASQAFHYLGELERACERLADQPMSGRRCEHIRPGLRRAEQGRHFIFYRTYEDGILVSRVLHGRMLPELHAMED